MSAPNSLFFLPDISGFTNFVNNTAAEHSQHIISELLEILIDNQNLGLDLAEIEGDAIFYYKHGSIPSPEDLMAQVKTMYLAFHNHLAKYEHNRICDCGACSTASELTLKFIVHAGTMSFIQVKDNRKPYGSDVILAHRLMKNSVPCDDYLLVSENLVKAWDNKSIEVNEELKVEHGCSSYESGEINYEYIKLLPLKQYLDPPPSIEDQINSKPLISVSDTIARKPDELFEIITNFSLRHLWNDQVDRLDYRPNRVNRVGEKHVCIIDDKTLEFKTVTKKLGDGKKVYGEYTKDIPLLNAVTTYFIVEERDDKSHLTIEAHPQKGNLVQKVFAKILKGPFNKRLKDALSHIKLAAEA